MFHILTILLCAWALFFFHSCSPKNSQRNPLSMSRATDDIIRDYTEAYANQTLFQTNSKTCPHCGKLVPINTSVGECMFQELAMQRPDSDRAREMFPKVRRQLRGEAADGYAPANCILGMIYENGLYGVRQDEISAARYYRLAADTGSPQGRAALAGFWIRLRENLPGAVELLKKAIEEEPRDPEFYLLLSHACSGMGKHREAFDAAKKAFYHSPVHSGERLAIESVFLQKIAAVSEEIGLDASLAEINDLIYLSPNNTSLNLAKAHLYASFRKNDEAEKEFTDLVQKYPDSPEIRLERAAFRIYAGNFNGAHEDVDSMLKKYPEDIHVRSAMLHLLFAEKKEKEAFAAADQYIKENPAAPENYCMRARLHAEKKEYSKALEDLKTAQKYDREPESLDPLIKELQDLINGKTAGKTDFLLDF